jgi:hypothetical protein
MATLYLTEFAALGRDVQGATVLAGDMSPVAEQTIVIGASSTMSAPFNTRTQFVMVHTDATCSIAIGPSPVAVAPAHRLAAGERLFYSVVTSAARVLSAATLPAAPVAVRNLWQPSVSATATTGIPPFVKDEIAGAIAISPGCAVSLSALSALSGAASMTWAELPA